MSRVFIASIFVALVQARFGQEQGNGAISAISALGNLGQSGQAATLAGGSIQFLLAAANPCGKLKQADQIITELGTSAEAVAAARGLVAAEQNFNPFVVSIPNICSDPTLPASKELRGVVPLIDPAVGGSDLENANSKKSVTTPFDATGLSVAQVMVAQGFSNFTAVDASGAKQAASELGGAAAGGAAAGTGAASAAPVATGGAAVSSAAPAATSSAAAVASSAIAASQSACAGVATTFVTVTAGAAATDAATAASSAAPAAATSAAASTGSGAGAVTNAVTGNFDGFVASSISGLDFGKCVPTMKFEAGLNGRKETEKTFQAIDPLVNKGQEEALNPAIIMNRIKDQLTNVCGANQAAKDAAVSALATVSATGVRDATTADQWNTLLGFAGTNTNPDNAPQTGLVGHT